MPIRFCAYQYQNLPLRELQGRWRRAEELGFDVLWNVDTVVDPDRPRSTMFDGPATLAVMAVTTAGIRIGTLVTIFPPLTPWESAWYFRDMVGRYAGIGIDEFVLYWPRTWRDDPREDRVFEQVCADVIPGLRETTTS